MNDFGIRELAACYREEACLEDALSWGGPDAQTIRDDLNLCRGRIEQLHRSLSPADVTAARERAFDR